MYDWVLTYYPTCKQNLRLLIKSRLSTWVIRWPILFQWHAFLRMCRMGLSVINPFIKCCMALLNTPVKCWILLFKEGQLKGFSAIDNSEKEIFLNVYIMNLPVVLNIWTYLWYWTKLCGPNLCFKVWNITFNMYCAVR